MPFVVCHRHTFAFLTFAMTINFRKYLKNNNFGGTNITIKRQASDFQVNLQTLTLILKRKVLERTVLAITSKCCGRQKTNELKNIKSKVLSSKIYLTSKGIDFVLFKKMLSFYML